MSDFRPGDEVLATWLDDGFLYPGIVVRRTGDSAHIAYLDGATADVPIAHLRHATLGPGIQLQVNWQGKGGYYEGRIVQRMGAAIDVAFDDGERSWSTIAQCRIPHGRLDSISRDATSCRYCGSAMAVAAAGCPTCGAPQRRGN